MTINVDPDIDRILTMLTLRMREKGFTQQRIQEQLNWKGSYISQLLGRTKSLRVEQVLKILSVIGVEPSEFFGKVFPSPEQPKQAVPPPIHQALLGQMKRGLQATCALIEVWLEEGGEHGDQRRS